MTAIETLRDWTTANHDVAEVVAALAKLETLLQAAERVVERDGTGRARLDALAAAVRDAKGDTT